MLNDVCASLARPACSVCLYPFSLFLSAYTPSRSLVERRFTDDYYCNFFSQREMQSTTDTRTQRLTLALAAVN